MNRNILQVTCLQEVINSIYSYISQNLSTLIYNVLIEYECVNKKDKDIQYINEYIKHYLVKNNSEIINLLINNLLVDSNTLKSYINELNSSISVVKDIMEFKNNNIDNFTVSNNNNPQHNKKTWQYMGKAYKELFISEKEYIKGCILSDIYAYPNSLDSTVSSEIKEFFLYHKNNASANKKTDNSEKLDNIQEIIIRNVLNYTKLNQQDSKKYNDNYIKHVSIIKTIDNYINEKLVSPIVLNILSVFDNKKKINVDSMNEYISLNYKFSCSLYYYVFFREYLFQQEQISEDLIKNITEVIYIELLHDSSKFIISQLLIKDILSKSNFYFLDKVMQNLYKNEGIYNKLLMVKNYNLSSSEQIRKIFIEKSKKELINSFDFIKEEKSSNNYYYDMFYKLVNKIYENKEVIGFALLSMFIYSRLGFVYTLFSTIRNYVYDISSFFYIKDIFEKQLDYIMNEEDDDISKKQLNNLNNLINNDIEDSRNQSIKSFTRSNHNVIK